MSCGRNYVHGQLAMSKLGGPLSVVKVLNFLSFHYLKWSRFQRLFHCDGVLISIVSPGLLADRVFSLACPGFALRASSFNSGPCVGVSSRCLHSLRCLLAVPLCSCCTCPSQSVKQVVQQFMGKLPRPEIARWNWIRFVKVWGMSFSEHETIYERYR